MKRLAILAAAAIGLAGCSGMRVTTPAQPTPSSIESTVTALASISTDPVTAWQAGSYAVRAACDAYLNAAADQSASIGQLGVGVGVAGAAGSMINPFAGVASSLVQSFLTAFQAAGALPYSAETSALIQNALDAYDSAVAPPASLAEAANDAEGAWWLCTPAGYAVLASQAIGTAQVSAGAPMTAALMSPASGNTRPPIRINGH